MLTWYVAHTQPRAEELAKSHLQRQGFTVYLPHYAKRRRHARRVDTVAAPLFPRYVFVAMDIDMARWRAIHSTRGVQYLVCNGDRPVAVPDGVIDEIRAREDESGMVMTVFPSTLKPGEPVRIVAGPLSGHEALFQCESDKDRVIVLLSLLGRTVRTTVPLDAIVTPALA